MPLSGDAATYGTDIRNALEFANKKVANGAYELIIEDDRCSDREAVTVARKLVDIDKIDYAIGFGCSGSVLASAPVYERAKIIAIAAGGGAPDIAKAGDYIFRTIPNLTIAAAKLYRDAARKHKKIGIITEETAYCQGLTEAFIEQNQNSEVTIINESFLSHTSDFRTLLSKMKAKGVEALFINPQTEAGLVTIYKQLQTLEWPVQVYGAYWPGTPTFLEAFGTKADGVIYATLPFNDEMLNETGRRYYEEFEQQYGPPRSGRYWFTLTYAAFEALHKAIESGQDPKKYLYSNEFRGIVDGYSFDKNGDVVSGKITFVLKVIRNGKPSSMTNL